MRNLYAVTRATLKEALRTRVVAVFVVILAVCLIGIALAFTGDGTLPGRIRTFLSYSVILTQLLLAAVTIFLSVGIVAGDIARKSIFIVVSKPLARWQYVVGRWLGVVVLNVLLVGVAGGAIYALAQVLRRLPTQVEQARLLKELPLDSPDPARRVIDEEIFAARAVVQPDPIEVESDVQAELQRRFEESGRENVIRKAIEAQLVERRMSVGSDEPVWPEEIERLAADPDARRRAMDRLTAELRQSLRERRMLVRTGGQVKLTFSGLPTEKQGALQLDYRLQPMDRGIESIYSTWILQNTDTGEMWLAPRTDPVDTGSTLTIPAQAVSAAGKLTVFYLNNFQTGSQVKVAPQNLALYHRLAGFEGNFLRAMGIALLRLVFLSAVGVLLGVCVSFPVATLAGLLVLTVGIMGPFIAESTALPRGADAKIFDYYSHYVAELVFLLMPKAPIFSTPSDHLADGVWIPGKTLAAEAVGETGLRGIEVLGRMLTGGAAPTTVRPVEAGGTGVRALVAIALACLAFRRRELARVQV